MFTIFAFLITLVGSVNWLMIGLFQYDFIAGIFGYQASIFSFIFYTLFGISSLVLVFKLIKGKGTIAVFSRKNKKNLAKNIEKAGKNMSVEAGEEMPHHKHYQENQQPYKTSETPYQISQSPYQEDQTVKTEESQDRLEQFDRHYRK